MLGCLFGSVGFVSDVFDMLVLGVWNVLLLGVDLFDMWVVVLVEVVFEWELLCDVIVVVLYLVFEEVCCYVVVYVECVLIKLVMLVDLCCVFVCIVWW